MRYQCFNLENCLFLFLILICLRIPSECSCQACVESKGEDQVTLTIFSNLVLDAFLKDNFSNGNFPKIPNPRTLKNIISIIKSTHFLRMKIIYLAKSLRETMHWKGYIRKKFNCINVLF